MCPLHLKVTVSVLTVHVSPQQLWRVVTVVVQGGGNHLRMLVDSLPARKSIICQLFSCVFSVVKH